MAAGSQVLMYKCDATFTGETVVRYEAPPQVGSERRCILFVRESETSRVHQILRSLGWEALRLASQPLGAEELEQPGMENFRPHYEACLRDGHSLVWYS